MRCEICSFENPENATVCEHCGCFLAHDKVPPRKRKSSILDPLGEKRIRCAYCWHSNPAGSKQCERCGMELSYVPYPDREGEGEEYTEREEEAEREWENTLSAVEAAIEEELGKPEVNPVPEGMIRCRNCWQDNSDTAKYCLYCDQKLDRPRRKSNLTPDGSGAFVVCRTCGRRTDADSKECLYCGFDPQEDPMSRIPRETEPGPGEDFLTGTIAAFRKARVLDLQEEERKQREEQEKIERSKRRGSVNYAVPGKKRCRSCWYDNPISAERCEQCGASLSKVRPRKGKSNTDK